MEPTDLTIEILKDIRSQPVTQSGETAGVRKELAALRTEFRADIAALREELRASNEMHNQRFEVIETAIRDMSEQLVMLARGIRSPLDVRGNDSHRIDDLERRVTTLEQRAG